MSKPKFVPLIFDAQTDHQMQQSAVGFMKTIVRRRSVREFSDRSLHPSIIDNALIAAGSAPSGANQQPWHFVVVTDPSLKSQIRQAAEEEEREFYQHRASEEWLEALSALGTDEHKPFLEIAPYLVVVFQKKFSYDKSGARRKNYYTPESVGIACGILISALHFSGLATLTHTPSPMKFLNRLLKRPLEEKPYMIVVAGHPAADAMVPEINKYALTEISSYNP